MGEFLIAPVVILVIALAIWFVYFASATAKERRRQEALPDDPYARREAELDRMRAEHEAARPENVTHPARRP